MKQLFFLLFCGSFFSQVLGTQQTAVPSSMSAPSSPSSQTDSSSEQQELVLFTPPSGWHLADNNLLPSHVKVMVVGKGPSTFPPSMNLSLEPYKGTLKQYLKTIKNMNAAQGFEWKDLGIIRTEAGNASLSQVDTQTQWGNVRLMHVILLKNGTIYILTASALKQDFSLFYKDFFAAMRSLRVAKDVYDMVVNLQQRTQLKAAAKKLQSQWLALLTQKQRENPAIAWSDLQEEIFKSDHFQNSTWKPFQEMLNQKYSSLGAEWQSLFLQKLEDELFKTNP